MFMLNTGNLVSFMFGNFSSKLSKFNGLLYDSK